MWFFPRANDLRERMSAQICTDYEKLQAARRHCRAQCLFRAAKMVLVIQTDIEALDEDGVA